MKPSERILDIAFGSAAHSPDRVIRGDDIARAVLTYLDELDEQRKGAPELWAVYVITPMGRMDGVETFSSEEEARECIPGMMKNHGYGYTYRLARFVGEFVDG